MELAEPPVTSGESAAADASGAAGGSALFGQVVWLAMRSPLHQGWLLADIERFFVPPLLFRQFKLYRDGDRPHAFVSWAFFDADAEARYLAEGSRIKLDDWRSGDRLWIIDFIAPFGDARGICRDLRTGIFAEHAGKALRSDRARTGRLRVMGGHGVGIARQPGPDSLRKATAES